MTRKHRLRQALKTVRDLIASRDEPNWQCLPDEAKMYRQAVDLWIEFGGVEAARLLGIPERDVVGLVVAASEHVTARIWHPDDT